MRNLKKIELFLENRIKWKASQHNLPNKNVFFFENLENNIQSQYLNYLKENDAGKIILLYTNSKKYWTAIGTKKIVGYDGVKLNSVILNSIETVISKNLKEQKSKSEKINKKRENELLVIDNKGKETVFITNEGKDFFSLWSIILMIIRLNK